MNQSDIRTLIAVDDELDAAEIQRLLPLSANLQVVGVVVGMDESWRTVQDSNFDLLVVACGGYSEKALYLIENTHRLDPSRPILVLGEASPNGFLRRAFEAGADDILTLPQTPEQLGFALRKVVARKEGASGGRNLGRLVCVLGPKGGTGKTLTACNLGVALAVAGERVALVDLDLQFGDVALCLGLSPDRTIHDLATSGGSLDADKVDSFLVPHSSGLRALLAPSRPDHASSVTVELVRETYGYLRTMYDWVIVDTPPGFTAEVIASIDASTDVVMVGMLDSLSLKNTKLGLETLELINYDPNEIVVVLNRAHSKVGISQTDVSAILGRVPDIFVPSAREIPRAVNEGLAIVAADPQSEPAIAFRRLASRLQRGLQADGELPLAAPVPTAVEAAPETAPAAESRFKLFGRKG